MNEPVPLSGPLSFPLGGFDAPLPVPTPGAPGSIPSRDHLSVAISRLPAQYPRQIKQ